MHRNASREFKFIYDIRISMVEGAAVQWNKEERIPSKKHFHSYELCGKTKPTVPPQKVEQQSEN